MKHIPIRVKPVYILIRFLGIIALFSPLSVLAKKGSEIYTGPFNNIALQGYDAVSYFKDNKPLKGKPALKTTYRGAVWYFSSEDNLKTFIAQPEIHIPQYGGYCAWAVAAKGALVKGNAQNWKIVDGKLYLNYNGKIQKRWEKNFQNFILKANKQWPAILNK